MSLPEDPTPLAAALVAWFARNRRALPWRDPIATPTGRDPYRVWLSEVMLQQTRVNVVEDYYARFLARFPTVSALAAADEDAVLSLWSGLGYYSRGRNLHRAARTIVEKNAGVFPATVDGLRALPGVGDYTASAVASFAFNARAAVVDGNVARVMSRLCDDATPIYTPKGKAATHARVLRLVDAHTSSNASANGSDGSNGSSGSSAVNEGVMELGALVCTPTSPACLVCPWSTACAARKHGTIDARPVKAPKRAPKKMHVASVVVVDERGRVWLERRESRGLFGGLLEPPSLEVRDGEVVHAWRALVNARGLPAKKKWPAPIVVERSLTHRDLTFSVVRIDVSSGEHANAPWVHDIENAALSTAVRAILAGAGVVP